jgi:alpha-tubulin suppressor-like RCC1 family protein
MRNVCEKFFSSHRFGLLAIAMGLALFQSVPADAVYYNLGAFFRNNGIYSLNNEAVGGNPGDGSTVVLTVKATKKNSLLVASLSWCCGASSLTVTDNQGNLWASAGPPIQDGGGVYVGLYYAIGTNAGVTAVSVGGDGYVAAIFSEYANVDIYNPLDTYVSALSLSTTTADSGALTPAGKGELLVVVADDDANNVNPGAAVSPFKLITAGIATTTAEGVASEYYVDGASAAIHGTMTFVASYNLPIAMAAFRPAKGILEWSPLANDFGNVNYGYGKSYSSSYTLSNSLGVAASSCSAPTLTGTNPTSFEIPIDGCGAANLAGLGGTCAVKVRANLTGTGLKTATLSRTCTVGGTAVTYANQIQATGVTTDVNLVMRSEVDGKYGDATVLKKTSTKDIIIGNTGTTTASGCGAPTLGSTTDFTLVSHNCGTSIASGAHCTAKVFGVPSSLGAKSTTLSMSCTGATTNLTLNVNGFDSSLPAQTLVGGPTIVRTANGYTRYTKFGSIPYLTGFSGFTTATMAAAGESYFCALLSGSTVQCYGSGYLGKLGDGTGGDAWSAPVTVSGISNAISVNTNPSGNHTCSVLSTGAVKCWGENTYGQLGNNSTTNSNSPVTVSGISTATAVALGINHTCAILADKTMQCWGHNNVGQLGDGTTTDRLVPVTVQTSSGVNLTNVVSIGLGDYNISCAVQSGGTAKCWGDGGYGQIGNSSYSHQSYATAVTGITTATKIAAGYLMTCALLSGGTVQCWGENGRGELGDGTNTDTNFPVTVSGLSGATDISCVSSTACSTTSTGDIKCWGKDDYGSTGNGKNGNVLIATQKTAITGATQISTGDETICARLSTGSVQCWGDFASYGQSGSGNYVSVTVPVTISGVTTATQVAAASYSNCALLSSGGVQCWGKNESGQLGNGTTTDSQSTLVSVSGITTATQMTGGLQHFCARLSDGTVRCWGNNANSQLGDGTTTNATTPVTVTGLSGVTAVYSGKGNTTCAVLSTGDVNCWGLNDHGQIGDGTTTTRATATLLTGIHNVTSMALGKSHTCAVVTGGMAQCWGLNTNAQLGDNTTNESHTPIDVKWYPNIASLSAGKSHTCAVLTDGKARCWGSGSAGQLGDGQLKDQMKISSTAVFSLTTVSQVSSGEDYNCAVLSGGTVQCWGSQKVGIPVLGIRSVSGFIP